MIFIDSSFLISFALSTDYNHEKATKVLLPKQKEAYTSEDILKESLTIISQRKGKQFCIEFFDGIIKHLIVLPVTMVRFQIGLQVFLDPTLQKDISLIDCISAAICKELGIKRILTFDRHFRSFGLAVLPK